MSFVKTMLEQGEGFNKVMGLLGSLCTEKHLGWDELGKEASCQAVHSKRKALINSAFSLWRCPSSPTRL